jgi:allantoinase
MTEQFDLVLRAAIAHVDGTAPGPAAIGIRGDRIVAIGALDADFAAATDETIPADAVLIPGIVDTHVHVNEPGRTDWEGFASATAAAAIGGVTTIIDMPLNSIPPTTTPDALALKRAAAAPQAAVDVGFWGGAIPDSPAGPGSLGHLRELHDAGVFGFKCFLSPSGVDEFPPLSGAQLRAALAELADFGGLLIVHAEDPDELHDEAVHGADYPAFVASRPDRAETVAITAVIDALRDSPGARAHILHLSSAQALPAIRAAKAEGLPLTVETCPHYLVFGAEGIPDGATAFKCCPPIRSNANADLLWAALADGTIDLIASDHSPATAALKLAGDGDFGVAWGGISGLQVAFTAVWTQARHRGFSLADVLGWMSTATAAFVGLDDRGGIRVGARADLVAYAPDRTWDVRASALRHKNPISAYDDAELTGVAVTTWVGGRVAQRAGVPRHDRVGRLISRP